MRTIGRCKKKKIKKEREKKKCRIVRRFWWGRPAVEASRAGSKIPNCRGVRAAIHFRSDPQQLKIRHLPDGAPVKSVVRKSFRRAAIFVAPQPPLEFLRKVSFLWRFLFRLIFQQISSNKQKAVATGSSITIKPEPPLPSSSSRQTDIESETIRTKITTSLTNCWSSSMIYYFNIIVIYLFINAFT